LQQYSNNLEQVPRYRLIISYVCKCKLSGHYIYHLDEVFSAIESFHSASSINSDEKERNRAIEEERDALDEGQHNFCNNVCDLLGLKKRVFQFDDLLTLIKEHHTILKENYEADIRQLEESLKEQETYSKQLEKNLKHSWRKSKI